MARSSVRRSENASKEKLAGDKIFEVAADLFYREGVRAVGVEGIVQQAGVAKISLYRNFPSKDALALAYLENRSAVFLRQWDGLFAKYEGDPHRQLQAVMTYLARRTTQPGYLGCPFINFCSEFRDPSHPGRRVAAATKAEMLRRFLQLAQALGVPRPKQLADGLMLLVEGAYAISQTLGGGPKGPGKAIVWAAKALVDGALRGRETDPK